MWLLVLLVGCLVGSCAAWARLSKWTELAGKFRRKADATAEWEEAVCSFTLNGYPYMCMFRIGASRDGLHLSGIGGSVLGPILFHPAILVPW
eukprot:CAMPEP_0167777148 /NCGR_PEP_ID=MMETSP0111_2-20121227/3526_1 /TAXON_ID=91324 /ORGANISM="Lotharella globosa, Strain CCCM811" /LENGTH=91 /DNA_ID=CAMNT_0007667287 /DNA_START=1 /DNA_END=273 /DNA_ORIENTATION=+